MACGTGKLLQRAVRGRNIDQHHLHRMPRAGRVSSSLVVAGRRAADNSNRAVAGRYVGCSLVWSFHVIGGPIARLLELNLA